MFSRVFIAEIKWIIVVFIISFVLVYIINNTTSTNVGFEMQNTFFGLNLFMEILVFSVFSAFVVFGIRGFFESYSQKYANVIIFSSGILMAVVIFILSYQILFLD